MITAKEPGQQLLRVRQLEKLDYQLTWDAMKQFCQQRDKQTPDEVWFVQHPAVYTQGVAGKAEHILQTTSIPVVQSDRGGQVTYHGPGQIVMYVLFDLRRLGISVRALVSLLEDITIAGLKTYGLHANSRKEAPGVYIQQQKIASLGLRVKKGCTYHGLSVNIDMDLAPFNLINPCGMEGLKVTQLAEQGITCQPFDFAAVLLHELTSRLPYSPQLTHSSSLTV